MYFLKMQDESLSKHSSIENSVQDRCFLFNLNTRWKVDKIITANASLNRAKNSYFILKKCDEINHID